MSRASNQPTDMTSNLKNIVPSTRDGGGSRINTNTNEALARMVKSNKIGQAELRLGMLTSDPGLWPRIVNVVGHFKIDCLLDLSLISHYLRNCEYRSNRFAAAIVRICNPRTTALIFSNGNYDVTGAKSASDCKLAARKYVRMWQKLGFAAKCKEFAVVNVVANACVFGGSKGARRAQETVRPRQAMRAS